MVRARDRFARELVESAGEAFGDAAALTKMSVEVARG